MNFLDLALMTGPISTPSPIPSPTLIFSACALIFLASSGPQPPTAIATGRAMQRSPAAPNAAADRC